MLDGPVIECTQRGEKRNPPDVEQLREQPEGHTMPKRQKRTDPGEVLVVAAVEVPTNYVDPLDKGWGCAMATEMASLKSFNVFEEVIQFTERD